MKRERLAFDLESDGLLDELTTIHCISIKNLDEPGQPDLYGPDQIGDALNRLDKAVEIWGHNIIDFDIPAIRKVYPDFKRNPAGIYDTLVMARLVHNDLKNDEFALQKQGRLRVPPKLIGSQSLEAWGYRLGILKGEFGKTTDWSKYTAEMGEYCKQDVVVTEALVQHLLHKQPDPRAVRLEHNFATLISCQMRCGVGFDTAGASALAEKVMQEAAEVTAKLQEVFPPREEEMKTPAWWSMTSPIISGEPEIRYLTKSAAPSRIRKDLVRGPNKVKKHPFMPGSRTQIADRLREKYGWESPTLTDTGRPKIDENTLSACPHPEAALLKHYLVLGKLAGQVATGAKSWTKHAKNGRIHGRVNTGGAVTGRCTHASPNLAQVPSGRKLYGKECRSLFHATHGRVMVGCDASGLEARCLAHYLHPYDDGNYANIILSGNSDEGTDIHSLNARAQGMDPKTEWRDGQSGRDIAKTLGYGLMYGSGATKAYKILYGRPKDEHITEAKRDHWSWSRVTKMLKKRAYKEGGPPPTDADVMMEVMGGVVKKDYIEGIPGYGALLKDLEGVVDDRGYLRGLDGRHLPIRAKHAMLNTLLQSAGAVIMKWALCEFARRCHSKGWVIAQSLDDAPVADIILVLNVHDEAEWETYPDIAEETGQLFADCIRDAGEHFNFLCPLAGDFRIGANWYDVH